MSEFRPKNNITESYKFNQINYSEKQASLNPLQKLLYFFLIFLLIFFLFIFIAIIVLLIRRQIHKFFEKMRRIKLQNEINKIMMIDIFETRSPPLETQNNEFHSINNDSSLSDISNSSGSSNVLSEINVHNDVNNSKDSNDN